MITRRSVLCHAFCAAAILGLVVQTSTVCQAEAKRTESRKPVITAPKFDPTAERVGLFDGMEDGRLESKVVAVDATGGYVVVSNASEVPLTVELPDSFVAVQVLKQLGGLGGGGMGGMGGGMGGMGGGMGGQQGGQNQNVGGGMGGGGMGGGGMGGGFFSIPPERSVKVPYVSACLNHGKADPNPRINYRLVRTEEYTQDPVLAELIRMVGTGRVDQHSAQAAIWQRTDNMSWQQLATKSNRTISGTQQYFHPNNITIAQRLMATAEGSVREAENETGNTTEAENTAPRVR
jgi:hypothetical protein